MTWLYKIEIQNGINKKDSHIAYADSPKKALELTHEFISEYEKDYKKKSYYWNVAFHTEFQKICIDFGSHVTFSYIHAASKELYNKLYQYWLSDNKEEPKDEEN